MSMLRGQRIVQMVLLGMALVSAPSMMLQNPLALHARHQKLRMPNLEVELAKLTSPIIGGLPVFSKTRN